tara:strand:+ start:4973 stop:6490 length:1518 start_codon:yes stop_codon:yes gene_type:complete
MRVDLPSYQDWVDFRAHSHPDVIALEFSDRKKITYAELNTVVYKVTSALNQNISNKNSPIALLTSSSFEFSLFLHAIPRLGTPILPLNIRLKNDELLFQLREANVCNLIVDESCFEVARKLAESHDINIITSELLLQDNDYELPDTSEMKGDDVHSIIFTSGTTGKPKAVMLTNGNYYWSAVGSAQNLGVDNRDRWLLCMPYYHVGGLSILMRSAIYGTCAVIHEGFDQELVNSYLRNSSITLLSVVPTMLKRMLEFDDGVFPNTIRAVLVGGGPVSKMLLEKAQLRGLPVLQTYGLTEAASQISTLSHHDAIEKIGSAGKALSINTLRVEKNISEEDIGEILVKGPTVTVGYFAQSDATQKTIVDGWLHTGDIGHLDDEGYLFISDRRDDLIVTGGENVYPAEVENVLSNFANIAEAAVIGFPDDEWGQKIIAVLVLTQDKIGINATQLKNFLDKNLANYKHPRQFFISEQVLPRTISGKLQRHLVHLKFESNSSSKPIELNLF